MVHTARFVIPFCVAAASVAQDVETVEGFVTVERDRATGKVSLVLRDLDREFLLVDSLPGGLGSNDVGLDRGKLGRTRLVRWHRSGSRVLLVEPNLKHRATTDNAAEKRAVEQAFARSVIWAFDITSSDTGRVTVDATGFCERDAFGVVRSLKRADQGDYKLDAKRSFVELDECKAFPRNTELTSVLTFAGKGNGSHVRGVTPSPESITVQQRLSLIALPDDGYERRAHDPRSGYMFVEWQDYAVPIAERLTQRFIRRHRLGPGDSIVYYVDSGAPEPIRSALLDGARWWAKAFDAAGFPGAYRVEVLPEGIDPMDARYNVIQWVHRSSRGWSYGNSIADPRTGEIIKGHVSLGSRRVRQDFLLAQSLVGPDREACEEMALARLRQLSAHEVGHTLGLVHNFAASTNDRASVMDYPHPVFRLDANGAVQLDDAYAVGVGAWDVFTIRWGYGESTAREREQLAVEARAAGLRFASDSDARSPSSMHPFAHLWDNGVDPVAELAHLLAVRRHGLSRFGPKLLAAGDAPAHLDELLTPLYLMHRYQVEAVAKLVGGASYEIGVPATTVEPLGSKRQREALQALVGTLSPDVLAMPASIPGHIPARTHGARRSRELLPSRAGGACDPIASAEALASHTVKLLVNRTRASRLIGQAAAVDGRLGFTEVLQVLVANTLGAPARTGTEGAIQRAVDWLVLDAVIALAADESASRDVRAIARHTLETEAQRQLNEGTDRRAHRAMLWRALQDYFARPHEYRTRSTEELPPGSPIGCGCDSN